MNQKENVTIDIRSSNPRTKEYEPTVQNILYLQHIANTLPNAFTCHQIVTISDSHLMC